MYVANIWVFIKDTILIPEKIEVEEKLPTGYNLGDTVRKLAINDRVQNTMWESEQAA